MFAGVKQADQKLLLNVFAVPQCDRVEEGDAFIPPDPNMESPGQNRFSEANVQKGSRRLKTPQDIPYKLHKIEDFSNELLMIKDDQGE